MVKINKILLKSIFLLTLLFFNGCNLPTDQSVQPTSTNIKCIESEICNSLYTTGIYIHPDLDFDGWGDKNNQLSFCCDSEIDSSTDLNTVNFQSPSTTLNNPTFRGDDCNDNLQSGKDIHPLAFEICDGTIDHNCDDQVDEGCTSTSSPTFTQFTSSSNNPPVGNSDDCDDILNTIPNPDPCPGSGAALSPGSPTIPITCSRPDPDQKDFCYYDSNDIELRIPIPVGQYGCDSKYGAIEKCEKPEDNCFRSTSSKVCPGGVNAFCYGPNGEGNDGVSGPVCKDEEYCDLSDTSLGDGSNRKLVLGGIVCSDYSTNEWIRCKTKGSGVELIKRNCEQGEFCIEGANEICSDQYCSEDSTSPNKLSYGDLLAVGTTNPFFIGETRCSKDETRAVMCYENGLKFCSPGGKREPVWPFNNDGNCEQYGMTCEYGPREDLNGKKGAQCVCDVPNDVKQLVTEADSRLGSYEDTLPSYLHSCDYWCQSDNGNYALFREKSCEINSGDDRIISCNAEGEVVSHKICVGEGMACLTDNEGNPFCGCETAVPDAITNVIKEEGYQAYDMCPFWCEYTNELGGPYFAFPGEKVCTDENGIDYVSICQIGGEVVQSEKCTTYTHGCEQDCNGDDLCNKAECKPY